MAVQEFYFFGSYNSCPVEAITYLNASGITDPSIRDNYCKFVKELKDNGVYSLIDVLYPDLGSNASQNKLNAINPVDSDGAFRRTFSGGVTFDPVTGTKGNGTNGYYDTKYHPNVNMSLATGGGLTISITGSSTSGVDIGALNTGGGGINITVNSSGYIYSRGLCLNPTFSSGLNASNDGIYSVIRESMSSKFSLINKGVQTDVLSTFVNVNLQILGLCLNLNGVANLFTNRAQQGVVIYKKATLSDVTKIETALTNMNARR